MKWPNHGGQPGEMRQLFKLDKDLEIIDFSANLNPLGPPSWLKAEWAELVHTIEAYPDPSYSEAISSIAVYEEVEKENVLLTNGGAEAIFLVAKYFENKKALIVQPTFLEYERACRHYHIKVEDVFYDEDRDFQLPLSFIQERMKETDVIFICRPNNPTGTLVDEGDLRLLLEEGKKTGTYIVVDEAFADFLPTSISTLTSWLVSFPNLILLRSLTKMYTIPGLRIGYVMAEQSVIKAMKVEQIPWSINSIANAIVPKLLKDQTFVQQTRQKVESQSRYLHETLTALDFFMSKTTVNFYLLKDKRHSEQTDELFHYLVERGILTRHTHNFKGLDGAFIRIAIRSKGENEKLIYFLKKWRRER